MDFKSHLKSYLSDKEIDNLIQSLDSKALHAAILNPRKMNSGTFLSLFPDAKPHPIVPNAFIYDEAQYQLGKTIYHELGCFYLQEPSAMVVSHLLNINENNLVLDLCAAPGGKSIQASFKMNNNGLIISNDLSYSRANIIKENAERLGIGNLLIISNDFSKLYKNFPNKFDCIILDAPCSGSGMFRKMEEMRLDWTFEKVLKNQVTQKSLILMSYYMLKPGGILSYSTCSFSKEEDEDVVKFLLMNSDAELIEFENNPLFYKSNENIGIHLLPSLFPGEGHYICQIKKPGILKSSSIDKHIMQFKNLNAYPNTFSFKDYIYSTPILFDTKKFNIIRYGLKVGKEINNFIKYDIHYAHYLLDFETKKELTIDEIKSYINGEPIPSNLKGMVFLTYRGIGVDIAKGDGKNIKNHYPKYLQKRKLIF